jgi:hypothetical protein
MSHKDLRKEAGRVHSGKVSRMLGGHVDKAADEQMIRKAFSEHDAQLHGGKATKLKFADGGKVWDEDDAPAVRRDRRAKGGAAKGPKHAHVNVIVAPQMHPPGVIGPPPGASGPSPMPPPPHPHPVIMPPPGPPPGPPGGGAPGGMAGGPPIAAMAPGAPPGLPLRKRGGSVSTGLKGAGAGGGAGRLKKITMYGGEADEGEDA